MRITQHVIVVLALCITAACGDGNSSPTAPSPIQPAFPQVSGNYSGSITLTYPEVPLTVTCPATTVITQSGSSVSIAPLLLSGACAGVLDSLPLGTVTIDTNGAITDDGRDTYTEDCGTYNVTGSGGFFGRELRFSLVATSTTCLNLNFTAVLTR